MKAKDFWLPKLPTCPYCNTVYRRADVAKIRSKREEICYHCRKPFTVSKKKVLVLVLELVLVSVIADILLFRFFDGAVLIAAFAVNVILIIIGIICIPHYIRFVRNERSNKRGERS